MLTLALEPGRRHTPAELLPHGPGFLLLDELVDYGAEHVCCAVMVAPAVPFFEAGRGVPGWVGIEYMAQTIGAYAGLLRLQQGLPIEIGLLLGTRSYEALQPYFTPGARLLVRAELLVRDGGGVAVFRCEIGDGSEVLARAEIKAFQPDNIDEYLRQFEERN